MVDGKLESSADLKRLTAAYESVSSSQKAESAAMQLYFTLDTVAISLQFQAV
jgi:hypothetical protein